MPSSGNNSRLKANLRFCKSCERMFQYHGYGYGYCEICTPKDNEMLLQVKEYLSTHPAATMDDTIAATGASLAQITEYLRDNRLKLPDASQIFISCEQCGADIHYGKYCTECSSLIHELSDSLHSSKLSALHNGKFHIR